MPELPDVEVFKKYLDSSGLSKKVKEVEIKDTSMFKVSSMKFKKSFQNRRFVESLRIGKNLFIRSDGKDWLLLHFGMTGYLEYYKENGSPPKYSKILFLYDNGYCLSFINKRKLGSVDITDDPEKWCHENDVGPDALGMHLKDFRELLVGKKSKVKAAITDQSLIAGIGNIYADEILYQARVHPETTVDNLSDDQIKEIHKKIDQVFATAIKNDAKPNELPKHWLIHSRSEGADCPYCNGEIKKISVGGRSTYFCEGCQEKG